jgi:hypothetical protein
LLCHSVEVRLLPLSLLPLVHISPSLYSPRSCLSQEVRGWAPPPSTRLPWAIPATKAKAGRNVNSSTLIPFLLISYLYEP